MHQLSFDITNRQFYIFANLRTLPHGSAERGEKDKADKLLWKKGVILNHIEASSGSNVGYDHIKTIYPGSPEMTKFDDIDFVQLMLQMILNGGIFIGGKRDNNQAPVSIVKRITVGFNQKQGSWSSENDHLPTGEWLPFFSNKTKLQHAVTSLNTNSVDFLRKIGKVFSLSQSLIDEHFQDSEPKPFFDAEQN